jgi:hypothetical protein
MERHLNTLFWQTFNINVNGMPTGDNTANFTVNTDSGTVQTGPATARLKRALRLKPTPRRKFLATQVWSRDRRGSRNTCRNARV